MIGMVYKFRPTVRKKIV